MRKRILVFPAGMPRSLAYAERAEAEGQSVVGSSSLGHDPAREAYPAWTHLPFVTTPEFDDALRAVIAEFEIGGIYTPNVVVWNYLSQRLGDAFPGVTLINASPLESEVSPYLNALKFGEMLCERPLALAAAGAPEPSASVPEMAALFRHAETIPGMCDHEKIHALCEVFRFSRAGDIVEIGSWWGKSAFVMLALAKLYGTGKLLCVDPWVDEHMVQNDDTGMVDQVPFNADEALTVFQLNLLPYAAGDVNYLRLPSVEGAARYRENPRVTTEVFGDTAYSGRISILHIDGNHSYEAARADVEAWNDLVMPGGWIIIDDYVWPYGDGPCRVGDAFLEQHADALAAAFVMGSALFIQLR